MIIPRVTIVLFVTFAASVLLYADQTDEAFNVYVEACRHSGYNPTEIATFQATLNIVEKNAWNESHVESIVDRHKKRMESLDMSTKSQQKYAEALEHMRQTLVNSIRTSTHKVFVRNSASLVGLPDARAHVSIINQTDKQSTFFSQRAGEQISAIQFGERTVRINKKASEPAMYHLNGRIKTPMVRRLMKILLSNNGKGGFDVTNTGIAAFKQDCEDHQRTFLLAKEKEEYDKNHTAYILSIHEKGKLTERFWIDPDRGYICPKIQMFYVDATSAERLVSETISKNFILDEPSQKWFPLEVVYESGKMHEVKTGKPEQRIEIRLVPGTLVLNQPISDSVFAITIQQSMRVDDFRRDDNDKVTFLADQASKLDLPTIAERSMDNIAHFTPREVAQYKEPYPIEKVSLSWWRIALMTIGIILIIVGLLGHFFKKVK